MSRGIWDRETVAALMIAALMPIAVIWFSYEGLSAVARFLFVLLVLAAMQFAFTVLRAQPASLSAVATALTVAMLAPAELGIAHLVAGVGFGAVMGELVFGGWGRNVVNPATVTLAFLGFGFPAYPWPDILLPVAWAAIPAAAIGLALGLFPGAILIAAGAVGTIGYSTGLAPEPALTAGAVVLVLLVVDPATTASTLLGRLLNGALYGGLILLFTLNWIGAAPVQIAVAAALLTSIATPLLDEVAIAIWLARRRRRHGRT